MNPPGAYLKATFSTSDRLVTARCTPGCDSTRTSDRSGLRMSNFALFWLIFIFEGRVRWHQGQSRSANAGTQWNRNKQIPSPGFDTSSSLHRFIPRNCPDAHGPDSRQHTGEDIQNQWLHASFFALKAPPVCSATSSEAQQGVCRLSRKWVARLDAQLDQGRSR